METQEELRHSRYVETIDTVEHKESYGIVGMYRALIQWNTRRVMA